MIAEDTAQEVIPAQVKDVISSLDYFLAENIRTARRFISSLKLGLTIEDLEFEVLDKNTPSMELGQLMDPVLNGRSVGVLSESGCPGIADPGARAVEFAHKHGIKVIPLVGPSSILMALMASGFNGQCFKFHGYLSVKSNERVKDIRELEKESQKLGQTQIFIETPYRNDQMLEDLLKTCQPETRICVAIGLSGKDERIISMPARLLKKQALHIGKIPTVFLMDAGT